MGVKGRKDVNYVVTGLPRSGTTYMMRCIEAGGIRVCKRTWRYELGKRHRFPVLEEWKGRCIKLFAFRLVEYDTSNCAIIWMDRNPFKIFVSNLRFGARIPLWLTYIKRTSLGWKYSFKEYESRKKECSDRWKKEALFFTECNLEEMDTYEKRFKFFSFLKKKGWPINPKAAATVKNDEDYRLKKRGRKLGWT